MTAATESSHFDSCQPPLFQKTPLGNHASQQTLTPDRNPAVFMQGASNEQRKIHPNDP